MTQETKAQTITFDDKVYDVSRFSAGVQNAIGLYNQFSAELAKEQVAVVKTQAALQTLQSQLAAAVRKELIEQGELPADESSATSTVQ